ncbi:MAG: hypothetical protein ACJ76O_07035, partial [Gaiellaceae bacterium]
MAVGAGHFEEGRQLLELRVGEEDAEVFAEQPGADVVLAVAIRAERRLRVVRVKCPQPVKSDPF